jgi:hypothetical protein
LLKSKRTSVESVSFWMTIRGGSGWATAATATGGGGAGLSWYATTGTGTLTRAIWSHGSAAVARDQAPVRRHEPKPFSTGRPSDATT